MAGDPRLAASGDGERRPIHIQAQQLGQVAGIGFIAAVLESGVVLDRRRVRKLNRIARFHQSIDQPVPVEGRLDHDPGEVVAKRLESLQYDHHVIGNALLLEHEALLIRHDYYAVVRMQIGSTILHLQPP